MNEHSRRATTAIGLPLAAAATLTAIGFGAPAVHAATYGALPVYAVAAHSAQPAHDDDVHVDSTFEAPVFPPAPPGTARTGVAIGLPGRPHAGGAAPTLTVPGVDPSLPWWLTRAALHAPRS